jgi:hypothetical protein
VADSFVNFEGTGPGDTIARLPLCVTELHECGAAVRGAPPFRSWARPALAFPGGQGLSGR